MHFSLITVALCAAVLSPVATFGHEGHHHDDDATNSTTTDPEVSAVVISFNGDAFTYLVPVASLSLDSITITDSGSPVSTALSHFDNHSSISVGSIEDISSISVGPIEDISSTSVGPVDAVSTEWVGRSNSSTDEFASYTLTPSNGTNRTGSAMEPTATGDSAAPTDVTGIAIRTTPAAAAMVAFIAAGLAVLEL